MMGVINTWKKLLVWRLHLRWAVHESLGCRLQSTPVSINFESESLNRFIKNQYSHRTTIIVNIIDHIDSFVQTEHIQRGLLFSNLTSLDNELHSSASWEKNLFGEHLMRVNNKSECSNIRSSFYVVVIGRMSAFSAYGAAAELSISFFRLRLGWAESSVRVIRLLLF